MNNFDFIEQIRIRPILWAKAHESDVAAKEIVWEEVSQIMGCPREVLKSRWKNLRDTYRKVIRKTTSRESPGSATWPYCQAMEFMRDILANSKIKVVDITTCAPKVEFAYEKDEPEEEKEKRGVKREADGELFDEELENQRLANAVVTEEEDEGDDCQFLLSLLPYIKQVPRCRKLPLRVKIEQLIYDEVYKSNNY